MQLYSTLLESLKNVNMKGEWVLLLANLLQKKMLLQTRGMRVLPEMHPEFGNTLIDPPLYWMGMTKLLIFPEIN